MKEANSDDEPMAQSVSVSSYHLEDEDHEPVSFAVLPIQWGDTGKNSNATKEDVFLRGYADNGLRMIMMQVKAWRFDLTHAKPEIYLLSSKGKRWIKLLNPRHSYRGTIRTILVTIHFLHLVKKNPQVSGKSLWVSLCKDKELSCCKPSRKDLLEHMPLIGEAAKRVAVLSKSKLLLMVLKENVGNKKLSDEEVTDLVRPAFIVDDADNGMMDEDNKESKAEDDSTMSVCALCDDGGDLISCEGPCMRSFHATVEDGSDSRCDSLGLTQNEAEGIQNFYCKNCKYNQHQCFACGKLGSSGKVKDAEVIKCASATCEYFYHPHCVAKLLPKVVKHVAKECERNVADAKSFTCPLHYCCVCKELENMMEPELQFAVCRRCPKSYHRKCLPRGIVFADSDEKDIVPRAWNRLLPNNRILIYCLDHEINEVFGTPMRNHIKFPNVKPSTKKMKSATKQCVVSNKNNADLDSSSSKDSAKGSKVIGKPSPGKVSSRKNSEKIVSGSKISNKNNVDLHNSSGKSSAKGSKVIGKPSPGKVGSKKKKVVPGSKVINKNNAGLDDSSSKCSAKGSKVTEKVSPRKLASMKISEKAVFGSNISKKRKADETSRNCLTENKISTSKKIKVANSNENKSLSILMRSKVSNQTKPSKVSNLICKTISVKHIKQQLPGSVDLNDIKMDLQNGKPPLLSHLTLQSHSNLNTDHKVFVQGNGGQKSSAHGDVDQESQEGQVSKVSNYDMTSLKRKHAEEENDSSGQGVVSTVKRNKKLEGVSGCSQSNANGGRSSAEEPVMACPPGPSEDQHSGEEDKDLMESNTRQRVDLDGLEDRDSRRGVSLSGLDRSCVHMISDCAQPSLLPGSSHSEMNAPDESNHGTMGGSLRSKSPAVCGNDGASGSRVPQCGYVNSLVGFALGPHRLAFSPHNSAGWISE